MQRRRVNTDGDNERQRNQEYSKKKAQVLYIYSVHHADAAVMYLKSSPCLKLQLFLQQQDYNTIQYKYSFRGCAQWIAV